MKRIIKRTGTFQSQLIGIFLIIFAVLFLVNIYVYRSMDIMIGNIGQTYVGNKNLMTIHSKLDEIQSCVTEYLNTKSTDSLTQFYNSETDYRKLIETLNDEIVGQDSLIMEKNIRNMSENYLTIVNKAIEAKRGRNVEEYQSYYMQGQELFDYLTTCIYSLNNTLFYNNSHAYDKLLDSNRVAEIMYIIILLLAGTLNVSLIIILTGTLTKPLSQLAKTAEEVGKGNLDIQLIETDNRTEIGVVVRAFNQMVNSLKDYIIKLKKSMEAESALKEKEILMEAYLKDAQLKYLQAQINPHFLFNTLNAGAQLAMLEEANETYRYIHKVAEFFRYNVKNTEQAVTLREEIKLVDDYIYILNVRYAGDIHYEKQVDDSLLNVSVPSMILQPIVENCIKHGFCDIDWESRIVLSVAKESTGIVVSIQDNGVGMTGEQIETILHSEKVSEDSMEEPRGIGLDNVIARLRNFYNCEDVIEITSVGKNMGTEVAVFIPIYKENSNV